ncbi:MAG: helix-turn-helix transcriptional regulator [Pseudomonadota bacterium]|nr:helix-turn-helix transcriptional regulator [Pseudomonadota bacterium]
MELSKNLMEFFSGTHFNTDQLSDYQAIFNLMPFCICWKDSDGRYLGRNQYAAEQMVFIQQESAFDLNFVMQKTDYDLFDHETADLYRHNDLFVLNQPHQPNHFVEQVVLTTGEPYELVSVKQCILDENNQPIGTLSCTVNMNQFIQPEKSLQDLTKDNMLAKLRKLVLVFMASKNGMQYKEIADTLLYLIPLYPKDMEIRKLLLLTPRELQCLCLLLKNFSAKQIGVILQVSFRTVEIHHANIKSKLYLPYKLEVIDWFWNLLSHL